MRPDAKPLNKHFLFNYMKYIVVTGGVISGLGKGIVTSSIGFLLKSYGYKLTAIKIDPYLNWDAGTINPYEHGEVFILDDGREVDLDLGNYERFLDVKLNGYNNITTGKIYERVIKKERHGDYLGKTVQIIPHVTNEIKYWIKRVAKQSKTDICLIEVGGTVGDIESMPFLEALRQLKLEVKDDLVFIHVTLIPTTEPVGEQKTKPTQHSVKEIREIGIEPDFIIGRSAEPLKKSIKEKISLFCNVLPEAVISAPDAKSIYQMPLILQRQGFTNLLVSKIGLKGRRPTLSAWKKFVHSILNPSQEVTIGIVGKYTALQDAYLSIKEAFRHAGAKLTTEVKLKWIEAEDLKKNMDMIDTIDGMLVPGGFGPRGSEGKILAIKEARKKNIPFLGICYGFQLTVVEFARNVLGLKGANSTEVNSETPHPVIYLMPEQRKIKDLGGTMRRGSYPVRIKEGTLTYKLYSKKAVEERHRHRYEVNPAYIERIERAGLKFSACTPDKKRMEIAELPTNSFFIASQFHPEFKSRPTKPSPLFYGLVKASLARRKQLKDMNLKIT
jgi:CTP synthase